MGMATRLRGRRERLRAVLGDLWAGCHWPDCRDMALGFGLLVCYIPNVFGWAIPTGWAYLSILLPWLVRPRLYPFLAWAILGLLWTPVWQQGVLDVWKLAVLSTVFTLGLAGARDSRSLLLGLSLGMFVSTGVAVAQLWGWNGVYFATTTPLVPAGLFVNPDMMGETAVLISVWLLASGLWWPLIGTLPAVYLSHSRLALLALAVALLAWLWDRSRWLAVAIMFLLPIVATVQQKTLVDSIGPRLAVWADTVDGLTWLGRGPGSFLIQYPAFATHTDTMDTRPEDAHNDFLQLAFQYGLGTFLLVPILLVGLTAPSSERFVLIAWCCIAFFSFPLAIPAEAFIGSFVLGRTWSMDGAHRRVWGLAYNLWAAVGGLLSRYRGLQAIPVASSRSGLAGVFGSGGGLGQSGGDRGAESVDGLRPLGGGFDLQLRQTAEDEQPARVDPLAATLGSDRT